MLSWSQIHSTVVVGWAHSPRSVRNPSVLFIKNLGVSLLLLDWDPGQRLLWCGTRSSRIRLRIAVGNTSIMSARLTYVTRHMRRSPLICPASACHMRHLPRICPAYARHMHCLPLICLSYVSGFTGSAGILLTQHPLLRDSYFL